MIRDAAFAMSTEQSMASPITFPATSTTGHLSTDYYDFTDIGLSGGREQYIEIEVTEAFDTAATFALAYWPDVYEPSSAIVSIALHRYTSQISLDLTALSTVGARFYLPMNSSSLSYMPLVAQIKWRYMNVFYLCAGTTAGKVTSRLVDAITHQPRRFTAANLH